MQLTDEKLFEWNQQGLIPGPNETEEQFLARAEACLSLKSTIIDELKEAIPFVQEELADVTMVEKAFKTTKPLFDIAPTWIPLFFSNHQLLPWHGGCAWIFQMHSDSAPLAFFQLRRDFANRDNYLGIYHRDELIAHELAHVGRMTFEEPKYEEFLAYRTSTSAFRRWWGPLLSSSYEALILLGLLVVGFVADLFALSSSHASALLAAQWWKLMPVAYFIYLLTRLFWRRHLFKNCFKSLIQMSKNVDVANAILFRLTDSEIADFSRFEPEHIKIYARDQAKKSLRWRLIFGAYFS